jgi:hypothetical protein
VASALASYRVHRSVAFTYDRIHRVIGPAVRDRAGYDRVVRRRQPVASAMPRVGWHAHQRLGRILTRPGALWARYRRASPGGHDCCAYGDTRYARRRLAVACELARSSPRAPDEIAQIPRRGSHDHPDSSASAATEARLFADPDPLSFNGRSTVKRTPWQLGPAITRPTSPERHIV